MREGLASAGIDHGHFRALATRTTIAAIQTGQRGLAVFAKLLDRPEAAAELVELTDLVRTRRTAVLCFERDERRCHRQVILARLLTSLDIPEG